ncbi:MAG: hypothetical protein D6824_09505 [Planctomycetota bacterium]|nr:MAG: hypothetical protein D6824_09505 [Planctomycetota bacterium]
MAVLTKLEIGRFTGRCAATGQEIKPGETYIAALIEPEPGAELVRQDYTLQAWQDAPRPPGLFAWWKTSRKPRSDAGESTPLLDDESLLSLFESLLEADSEPQRRFRAALTLLLIRRRLLREVGRGRRDGAETLLLRKRGEPDATPWEIETPDLRCEDVLDLMEHLAQLLRSEP